jgi:C4-dicarboxylate transporter, DctQ subunit
VSRSATPWLGTANRLEEFFLAAALAFMTIVTFVQVVMRHVFGTGLVWSLEATTYAFAWLLLVGMSYGVRTRSHIALDMMISRLPPRAARAAALVALGLCLAYCVLMLMGSATFVQRLYVLGHDARDVALPRWLLTAVMPPAFILLALRFLEAGWRAFTTLAHTERRR